MQTFNYTTNIVLIIAVGFLIYKQHILEQMLIDNNQSRHFYFALSSDGRMIPMVPLSDPNINNQALLTWASKSMLETLTFKSDDYRKKLKQSSEKFTKRGWDSFTQWLSDLSVIEFMNESETGSVRVKVLSSATLLEEKENNGRYEWLVSLPILFNVNEKQYKYDVQLLIVRVPRLEAENGVGIEQIIFKAN